MRDGGGDAGLDRLDILGVQIRCWGPSYVSVQV